MSDFDPDALQSEVYELISGMNTSFMAIVDRFSEAVEEAETKEDLQFIGQGAESVYSLLREYSVRLDNVLGKAREKLIALEGEQKAMTEFEKIVMSSLDKLPMTDMYDVR